jgi:hypothetical protein
MLKRDNQRSGFRGLATMLELACGNDDAEHEFVTLCVVTRRGRGVPSRFVCAGTENTLPRSIGFGRDSQ